MILILGPECCGKTSSVIELARMFNHPYVLLSINADVEVGDLLGGFGPIDTYSIEANATRKICDYISKLLEIKEWRDQLYPLIAQLFNDFTIENTKMMFEVLKQKEGEKCPIEVNKIIDHCEKILKKINNSGARFKFNKGALRICIELGYWVIFDNVDCARPVIIERLNSLGEENGKLHLSEFGSGKKKLLETHHKFRLICTANPSRVDSKPLSDAFYNRGIKIFYSAINSKDEIPDSKVSKIEYSNYTNHLKTLFCSISKPEEASSLSEKELRKAELCRNLYLKLIRNEIPYTEDRVVSGFKITPHLILKFAEIYTKFRSVEYAAKVCLSFCSTEKLKETEEYKEFKELLENGDAFAMIVNFNDGQVKRLSNYIFLSMPGFPQTNTEESFTVPLLLADLIPHEIQANLDHDAQDNLSQNKQVYKLKGTWKIESVMGLPELIFDFSSLHLDKSNAFYGRILGSLITIDKKKNSIKYPFKTEFGKNDQCHIIISINKVNKIIDLEDWIPHKIKEWKGANEIIKSIINSDFESIQITLMLDERYQEQYYFSLIFQKCQTTISLIEELLEIGSDSSLVIDSQKNSAILKGSICLRIRGKLEHLHDFEIDLENNDSEEIYKSSEQIFFQINKFINKNIPVFNQFNFDEGSYALNIHETPIQYGLRLKNTNISSDFLVERLKNLKLQNITTEIKIGRTENIKICAEVVSSKKKGSIIAIKC